MIKVFVDKWVAMNIWRTFTEIESQVKMLFLKHFVLPEIQHMALISETNWNSTADSQSRGRRTQCQAGGGRGEVVEPEKLSQWSNSSRACQCGSCSPNAFPSAPSTWSGACLWRNTQQPDPPPPSAQSWLWGVQDWCLQHGQGGRGGLFQHAMGFWWSFELVALYIWISWSLRMHTYAALSYMWRCCDGTKTLHCGSGFCICQIT